MIQLAVQRQISVALSAMRRFSGVIVTPCCAIFGDLLHEVPGIDDDAVADHR